MTDPRAAMLSTLEVLAGWDGDDPAALERHATDAADAVSRFAREVPPAETRGPEALAMLAGANATLTRALGRAVEAEARAAATDAPDVERLRAAGRTLRDTTARLARETAARVAR